MNVIFEKVDTSVKGNRSVELCKGEIPGAHPVHHTIEDGSEMVFKGNVGYYHIIVIVEGKAVFSTDGKSFTFDGRTTFVQAPDKDLTVKAQSNLQLLEIQWDEAPGDEQDLKEYKTEFPVVVPYQESIQYIDPNKSEKTISRMMIPHEIIPRFTCGSVESYGYDLVRPHAHPMLDQFFFSFPENDMDLIIDDEKVNMKGNIILHIPLGSNHGVEVTGDRHMHYMWIDFMPDKEAGLKRLNFSHRPTGTVRDFANEDKTR
jgi:mannose-6-phosphate isomerase-like protein (cupin superfamily)